MSNPTLQRLLRKTGHEDLISILDKLTLSELNSLMLEVYKQRASRQSVREIMKAYETNRFVCPSSIDSVAFLKTEIELLQLAEERGFKSLTLSPLAPLGSTSGIASVDQNKIVSALRGTEVVADATNVLALEAAVQRMKSTFDHSIFDCCSVHRHVRAQSLSGKGFTAHFDIFCAVSAGKDIGNFAFEMSSLQKHIELYYSYLGHNVGPKNVKVIIKALKEEGKENTFTNLMFEEIKKKFQGTNLEFVEVPYEAHKYYRQLRFSVNVIHDGTEYNIGDGGFVDWAEKLTGNKKERMLTSGMGIEFLLKLLSEKLV